MTKPTAKRNPLAIHLLAAKVPDSIWQALEHQSSCTGISKTDIARLALMQYYGIEDMSKPYVPKAPAKESAVTETV